MPCELRRQRDRVYQKKRALVRMVQKRIIRQHEARILMALYTSQTNRPALVAAQEKLKCEHQLKLPIKK